MKRYFEYLIFFILLIVFLSLARTRLAAFYYNRSADYYQSGLYEKTTDYLKRSIRIYPLAAVSHYGLGKVYLARGMLDRAISEYKEAIELDPHYVWAYQAIAYIYSDQQMYQEALYFLAQAKNEVKDNPEFQKLIRNIYFEYMVDCLYRGVDSFLAGEKQEAYQLLSKALRIDPDFVYTRYTLAYFYSVDEDYAHSVEELNRAIKIDPSFWPAHRLLGDIAFGKGNYREAMHNYKQVLSLGYQDEYVLNNLGLALMRMERYEQASTYLKQALKLSPDNVNIRYSLASVYRDREMLKEALAEYENLVKHYFDYPNIHNDMGDIYKRQNKNQQAREGYLREIKNNQARIADNPNDPALYKYLAHAYNGIAEYQKAKEAIKKAVALRGDYQDAYIALAAIHRDCGEYDQALAALEKAAALTKYNNFIYEDMERVKKLRALPFVKPQAYDKIYLKNGRMLQGLIKEESNEKIILEISIGNSRGAITLYRKDIKQIIRPKAR